jgi:hypothetical protein
MAIKQVAAMVGSYRASGKPVLAYAHPLRPALQDYLCNDTRARFSSAYTVVEAPGGGEVTHQSEGRRKSP